MRLITLQEANKRGCAYCMDKCSARNVPYNKSDKRSLKHMKGAACPHEVCPYTDLDEYETYEDYCKSLSKKCAEMFAIFA